MTSTRSTVLMFWSSPRVGILTLIFSVGLLSPAVVAMQSQTVKVMSYNILNGFDWGKDSVRQERLTDWIKQKSPDILALQELCGFDLDKLQSLAREWGHEHAIILKEEGYPVGLTSNRPINVHAKVREGLWHGMLHCTTWDIDFFVVHLSPADWKFRLREANIIQELITESPPASARYLVLGDFNAHSPLDRDFDTKYPYQLKRTRAADAKSGEYANLSGGNFDYSVMSTFLDLPLVDVCEPFISLDERTTCPSPINVPQWLDAEEILKTKSRIDFILASPILGETCSNAEIYNGPDTHYLSDHYPVMAWFDLP